MYEEGYTTYKICRNLNRSQKSIRNNLIRLGKIEGQITPIRYPQRNIVKAPEENSSRSIWSYIIYGFVLLIFTFLFIVHPHFNILELILVYIFL